MNIFAKILKEFYNACKSFYKEFWINVGVYVS